MLLRIFLVFSALGSLVLLVLIYAVVAGQTPRAAATASPSASGAASAAPSSSASAATSGIGSPEASAAGSAAASGLTATVTIKNLSFGNDLTVALGTKVIWDNKDVVVHTATNGINGLPANGALFDLALPIGGSASYTFDKAGTYQVTCKVHPSMNMTITVH
ncbi:MAG TPA: plastocyanin/azurin family copper-binding protein [Candidatus Saccharimonadales bacterium]|jgi:plastocyanin|nr:plastocyanin/azurin family copper-binding protein [Candidatus Saccharimonadales bacterium]